MTLADVRDFIESLEKADHVYIGKLSDKEEKSIGVYNSKHEHGYRTAIGGPLLESYGVKYVTLLMHWNKSPVETENAVTALFEALTAIREVEVNDQTIKFIQPLYEPQNVGTDDAGICEMVIEMAVIYDKRKEG